MQESRGLFAQFAKFSSATIASLMVFSLYSIVDGLFVARGIGEYAMSAVNLAVPFMNVLFSIAVLFAVGTSTAASRASGQRFSLVGGMKAENSRRKHRKTEPIFQGLWKRENDTRNRSRFSPNRAGEKGEANTRFRVFLSDSEGSVPKSYNQSCHHRCRHHGSHFHWL